MKHALNDKRVAILAAAGFEESDYSALVLPGGLFNPDELRSDDEALSNAKLLEEFQEGRHSGQYV